MPISKVNVKWGKTKYDDVELNTDEPPELFKAQLYALSGVPPDRQKMMVKGKTIPDHSWEGINVTNGMAIMMMGSTEAAPAAPVAASKIQSGKDAEAEEDEIPLGLTNLGNTCYLNATLQCFRAVPEIRKALKSYNGRFVGWETEQNKAQSLTAAMKGLYDEMDKYPDRIVPVVMVETLRKAYPRFAETGEHGTYVQQDANEAWTELTTNLRAQLPTVAPVEGTGGASALVTATNQAASGATIKTAFKNVIDQYMYGEFEWTMKCSESEQEPITKGKDRFLQFDTHIQPETKYLQSAMVAKLKDTVTKRAETLGRDAVFDKTFRLSRLPAHLTVQLVRFFFKAGSNVGAKVLKDVKFQLNLDVFDLCSEELQQKLMPNRLKFKEYEEAEIERLGKQSKLMKHEVATSDDKDVKYAPYWFEDDVGSNNSGYCELEAVLTHQGRTSNSGHYVAWVRKSGDVWLKFDDEKVTPVSSEDILKLSGGGDWHCAYLLLYGPRRLPILPEKEALPAVTANSALNDMAVD